MSREGLDDHVDVGSGGAGVDEAETKYGLALIAAGYDERRSVLHGANGSLCVLIGIPAQSPKYHD